MIGFFLCCKLFLNIIGYLCAMRKEFFKVLARFNKAVFPSFTKRRLDLSKASKWQIMIFGYRLWVTKNALD